MDKFLGFKTDEILTCLLLIVVGYAIAKMFNGCSNNGFSVGIQRRSDGNNCVESETCNAGGDTQYRYPCPGGGQCYNLVIDDGNVKHCINPEGVYGDSNDTYCIQDELPDPNIPVNCEGHWDDDDNCDKNCDIKYVVDTPASNGGKPCDDIGKTKKCKNGHGKCPDKPPVDCKGLLKFECLASDKCLYIQQGHGDVCIEKNKDCSTILEKKICNDSKECTFKNDKCMSDCGMYSKIGTFDLFGNNKYICPRDCYDSSLGMPGGVLGPGKIAKNSCTFFCDDLSKNECNSDPKCAYTNDTCTELKCNDLSLQSEVGNCRNILGCTYNLDGNVKSKCKNSCNDSTVFKKEKMCKAWSKVQQQREDKYKPIIQNINSSRKIDKDRYINYNLCEWNDMDSQCNIIT
jgi:hypothetical protein